MNEDKIIKKLVEHDEKFEDIKENMVTKEDYLQGQDEIITILKRLDEDRIFTHKWVERIESDLEKTKSQVAQQEDDINMLKTGLKIA